MEMGKRSEKATIATILYGRSPQGKSFGVLTYNKKHFETPNFARETAFIASL